jgi:AraC family transcriptional regulator
MFSLSLQGSVGTQSHQQTDFNVLAPALIKLLSDASNAVDTDAGAARSCLAQALAQLTPLCPSGDHRVAPQPRRGGLASWQESRVKTYIEAHIEGPIRVADLAAASRLSIRYFSHALRQSFGSSPQEFTLRRRIERAEILMLSTEQTFADIALACGFCDQAHFCKRFRKINGQTPKAWLREHRRHG